VGGGNEQKGNVSSRRVHGVPFETLLIWMGRVEASGIAGQAGTIERTGVKSAFAERRTKHENEMGANVWTFDPRRA
jgi:hypothetical protein